MAVEIPVYVNITGAFDRAVRDIPKEMPKLERAISKNVLNIPVYWTGRGMGKIQDVLTSTTISSKELKQVLSDLEYQFKKLSSAEAGNPRTSAQVKNLAKAYGLVEQRLKGVYNANTSATMMLENTINKVKFKIADLNKTLASQTVGSDAYNKTNYQLLVQKQRLSELEMQVIKYRAGMISAGNSGAASVDKVSASMTRQRTLIAQLTGYFSGLYAVMAVGRFVKSIRDVTGELEYQRVALGHLLQDVSFGNQLFDDIVEAAKKSPFRITQLVTYTKQLAAYQIEQDKIYDTTMRLADVSAGLGVDMNRLILAYGQVRAASVLRGQELRQFTEAGIPLVEKLAEKFEELGRKGTTTADVFKLISQRAVPFEMVKQIFEDMTNAGGMFYNMQEEQSKTLKGRWEKLKDAYDQALMRIGDDSTFQSWNDTVLNILNGVARNLKGIVRVLNAGTVAWITYSIATNKAVVNTVRFSVEMVKELGLMTTLKLGVESLAASFRKLMVAMASNWFGLALTAIAGLVTYFSTFKNRVSEATEELSDCKKAIDALKQADSDYEYGKRLIDGYKELASMANRTEVQNNRLATSMEELKKLYPDLADKIDGENESLEANVELLQQAADLKHEEAVRQAKSDLEAQKEVIRGLEEDEKAARAKKEAAERRLEEARKEEAAGRSSYMPVSRGAEDIGSADPAELKRRTIEAGKAAKAASDEYKQIAIELGEARKEADTLEKTIDPKKKTKDWQQWAKEIQKIQNNMAGDWGPLFGDDELQNFTSIYDLSGKLKKKIDDLKTSLTGMKSLLAGMTDKDSDAYKALSDEIKNNEKLMEMAEAIRIALGLTFGKSSGGSDNRLSNLKSEISEITNAYKKYTELLQYMSKDAADAQMKLLFPQLDGQDATYENTIKRLEDMRKKVAADLKKRPKDKVLLNMQRVLDTEISNLSFDKLKEKVDDGLKKVSDEMKRSETARKFYNDILDLTGDQNLATTLSVQVYGDVGSDFKGRIQKMLNEAFQTFDASDYDLWDKMRIAVEGQDWDFILKNIDKFGDKWKDMIKNAASDTQQFNADWLKDFYKTYNDASDLNKKLNTIEARRTQAKNEAKEHGASQAQLDDIDAKFNQEVAETRLEILKSTPEWIKAFEDLEGVGTHTLTKLLELIRTYRTDYAASLTPAQLRNLTQQEEKVENEVISRDPYKDTIVSMKSYFVALGKMNKLKKQGKKDSQEFRDAENDSRKALKNTRTAINAVSDSFNNLSTIVSAVSEMINFDEYSDGEAIMSGIAAGLTLVGTALVFINAMLALMETNPIVLAITGVLAGIAAIANVLSNLKVNRANRELEKQNKILDSLQDAYDRLDKAIEKAFGSDYIYNYNEQLKNLEAQVVAYEAQARAERSKGKKADEDAIKGYEDSARDAKAQIEEMQTQLSEFFSDSDITSAATDFAESWIEAYKEFGSTTDAMREKFDDMIQNMVVKSLAAQVMKNILSPVFKAIDDFASDGDLTASEIAAISGMTKDSIGTINNAMNTLMSDLAANGLNLRNTAGSFTGISRTLAGASEESINTLTAATNTQNFYVSYLPMISENVARILELMGGDASRKSPNGAGMGAADYYNQMLAYAGYIPTMNDNLAELLHAVNSVITPKAASTNTHCVAIK